MFCVLLLVVFMWAVVDRLPRLGFVFCLLLVFMWFLLIKVPSSYWCLGRAVFLL